ncbi:hypothetical protein [Gemmata sp.]|uniref:hypothetical protein n=1 Tax=Gemmata sp. TaxID=1914242 RepID=UPI003F6E7E7F
METAFLVCAALGGTLLVCQFVAGLVGFGADHDFDADHDHDLSGDGGDDHGNGFLSLLSLRAGSAAVTFFGLGGLTAMYYGVEEPAAFAVALGSGAAALYAVGVAMKSLAGLKADGTARVERSVGRPGTVYLRVPAGKTGPGKVHLMLQNRTVEYQAVTHGAELPTGTPIKVIAVVGPDTVEVEAA